MANPPDVRGSDALHRSRAWIALLGAIIVASITGVSAHIVRGVINRTLATAFVSSPSATQDLPIRIMWGTQDTGLRVACFSAANTSPPRGDDPDWPRVTGVGFELPGSPSGFALLEPLDGEWELAEGVQAQIPGHDTVTLDVAIVARVNPVGHSRRGPHALLGLPPGQLAVRGSGTRFCLSGPFPDTVPDLTAPGQRVTASIEQILNGVVVAFHRVEPHGGSTDVGVWESPLRTIPLPE